MSVEGKRNVFDVSAELFELMGRSSQRIIGESRDAICYGQFNSRWKPGYCKTQHILSSPDRSIPPRPVL